MSETMRGQATITIYLRVFRFGRRWYASGMIATRRAPGLLVGRLIRVED